MIKNIDGQVCLVHLVCLQTDNFCLFLRDKWTNDKPLLAWWANSKRIKGNCLGFRFPVWNSSIYQSWARAFFYASRSLAELFALALSRSFLGLKFRAFAFALPRSLNFRAHFRALFRAPWFFAHVHLRSLIFALVISCSCVYIRPG